MPKIEIYPEFPKPKWLKVGIKCCVLGEGNELYTVGEIFDRSALIIKMSGFDHGLESFSKLYRPGMMDFDLPRFSGGK